MQQTSAVNLRFDIYILVHTIPVLTGVVLNLYQGVCHMDKSTQNNPQSKTSFHTIDHEVMSRTGLRQDFDISKNGRWIIPQKFKIGRTSQRSLMYLTVVRSHGLRMKWING